MEKMMRKMGMRVSELQDVMRVVIEREGSNIIFDNPRVTILHTPQGDNYEIAGRPRVAEKEKNEQEEINEEDLKLVMDQTGVDLETARKALKESEGDIAQAILNIGK